MPRPVALVSVMHDPDAGLLSAMNEAFSPLFAMHSASFIVISGATPREVEARLRAFGAEVEREPQPGVGASRRQAIAMARRAGHEHLHYCDLDRALHWVAFYPDELAATLEQIPLSDFLVVGRTTRAFDWHPACMIQTESLANHAFALAYGREWDLCSATRGLSGRAADLILAQSKVRGVGTEGEWPALLIGDGDLVLDYVEVEGMEYETPDRYLDEVLAAGGVAAWTAAQSLSAANWSRRLAFAWAIADACLRPGSEGGVDIL